MESERAKMVESLIESLASAMMLSDHHKKQQDCDVKDETEENERAIALSSTARDEKLPQISCIICLGMGDVANKAKRRKCVAKNQLHLILDVVEKGKKDSIISKDAVMYAYDPISSEDDIDVLQSHGIGILNTLEMDTKDHEEDTHHQQQQQQPKTIPSKKGIVKESEEGKYVVSDKTLFFMPHCPFRLYSNLLWANWSKSSLSNIFIIGNSFKEYDARTIKKVERNDPSNCVLKALSFTEEIDITGPYEFLIDQGLNDSSLIHFPTSSLEMAEKNRVFDVKPAEYNGPIGC